MSVECLSDDVVTCTRELLPMVQTLANVSEVSVERVTSVKNEDVSMMVLDQALVKLHL